MRSGSNKLTAALRRVAVAGVLASASVVTTAVVAAAPASAAAPGVTYLCSGADYSCLAGSGYSGQSVWGSWGPGHNCVSYAAFRLAQTGAPRPWPDRIGNGIEWDDKARAAGVPVDKNPTVGSIAQWDNYGAGHVGYVEQVTASFIDVSEDNFASSGSGTSTVRRIDRGSQMFADADFIHVRDVAGNRVAAGQIGDGAVVDYQGDVYTIAGGAPVYVSSWHGVGGPRATTTLSDEEFASLRSTPANGSLVRGTQTGELYLITGGAPLYLTSYDVIGGYRPATPVDQAALDNAGAGGRWNHLASRPADGTTVVAQQRGEVYRFAGGAPVYVADGGAIGGSTEVTVVDQAAIDFAGHGGPWKHVSHRPDDGSVLRGAQTGRVYVIRGGHPVYVNFWEEIGGPQPSTDVDQMAIDWAGSGGVWAHLA